LDNQVSGHASGVTFDEIGASGVFVSPEKYIPPHLRTQVKPPGGCPGKTTPPSVTASGACLGETTPPSVKTPSVTQAYIGVTPKTEAQLEADESTYAITYVYGDREVKVWSAFTEDNEQLERDDIARNLIIWERSDPTADWFFCHMSGERIEAGETVSHGDRVLIRHRDEAGPHWWHRATTEMERNRNPVFIPPAHWLEDEDEDEDDCEDQDITRAEPELRDQVSTLRSDSAETKSALVSWNNQTKQMFFNPEHAIEKLSTQIKKQWGIPREVYWLQVNGIHECQTKDWPSESSIVLKVRGLGAGPKATTIWIDGQECRCWGKQTFEEVFEDRGIEIKNNGMSLPGGSMAMIGDRIGDYLKQGDEAELTWE
jgi:hypothetical protein